MIWKAVQDGVTWGLILACLFLAGQFAWTLFFAG